MTLSKTRTSCLLGGLSGLLVAACFPPLDLGWLAWLAWTPLLAALALGASIRQAALAGALHSMFLHVGQCWWMVQVMRAHGEIALPIALGMFAFGLVTVAPYGLLAAVATAAIAKRRGLVALLAFAPVTALIDVLRSHATLGHPWLIPGMTQALSPVAIGSADVGGVHGVGLIVLLGNVAVVALVIGWLQPATRRKAALVFGIAGALVVAALAHGVHGARQHGAPDAWARVIDWDERQANAAPIDWPADVARTAIVQGSQPQEVKVRSTAEEALGLAQVQLDLTARALAEGAQLVVWAESAHPGTTWSMPMLLPAVQDQVRVAQARVTLPEVIVGALVEERRDGETRLTNSALLVDAGGRAGRYDKRRLVPFGEYLPWPAVFGWFPQIVRNVGEMSPGESDDVVRGRHGVHAIVVCYEVVLPQRMRAVARNGADILVNVTNDGWYHGTWMPEQHLRFGILRAVESRKFLVRAANSGISAIIAPDGRIVGSLEEGRRGLLLAPVERRKGMTLYLRWGDAPVVILGALASLWALAEGLASRRPRALRGSSGDPAPASDGMMSP